MSHIRYPNVMHALSLVHIQVLEHPPLIRVVFQVLPVIYHGLEVLDGFPNLLIARVEGYGRHPNGGRGTVIREDAPIPQGARAAAAASRMRLVEESHRRGLLLFVPHIPGVLGRVEHSQDGYRWVDESMPLNGFRVR